MPRSALLLIFGSAPSNDAFLPDSPMNKKVSYGMSALDLCFAINVNDAFLPLHKVRNAANSFLFS
jgi:hypothetical protein